MSNFEGEKHLNIEGSYIDLIMYNKVGLLKTLTNVLKTQGMRYH
jgi:hypothetical protein